MKRNYGIELIITVCPVVSALVFKLVLLLLRVHLMGKSNVGVKEVVVEAGGFDRIEINVLNSETVDEVILIFFFVT